MLGSLSGKVLNHHCRLLCMTLFVLLATHLHTTISFINQTPSKVSTRISSSLFLQTVVKSDKAIPMTSEAITVPAFEDKYAWPLGSIAFSLLPLAPGRRRKTILEEVVPSKLWTLDQLQGIINVNVPVRSVVIKLRDGGLFVYNPIAPTPECIELLRQLEFNHGPVRHILLATVGLEHKAFLGPFSRRFPAAKVWVQPGQWSFPINLPSTFLGFPIGKDRLQTIPKESVDAYPWGEEFEHAVLGPLKFKSVGGFSETAVLHKDTNTLLLTDSIIQVSEQPPTIIEEDPRAILYHSKDSMLDPVQDSKVSRRKGWKRMALFALTFFPSGIRVESFIKTFLDISKTSKADQLLGEGSLPVSGALYPWTWVRSEEPNFKAISSGVLVAPILRELIFNREPSSVLTWVDKVSTWKFQRIIPSHLDNNIKATPQDFKQAFAFLRTNSFASSTTTTVKPSSNAGTNAFGGLLSFFQHGSNRSVAKASSTASPLAEDVRFLQLLSDLCTKFGIVAPTPV